MEIQAQRQHGAVDLGAAWLNAFLMVTYAG
jgi:hypothetical protein